MSSTIFEAPPYDPHHGEKRRKIIIGVLIAIFLLGLVAYRFRYYPEERVASNFFAALQQKDFEKAYGIWMHDPDWKQHAQKYSQYPFGAFYQDWGPGGEQGAVRSYKIVGADSPKNGSGVVVVVNVNDRADPNAWARVWVEKRDKTMTFSPGY